MDEFWMWATGLPGAKIRTATGRTFEVTSVSRLHGITITPESSGIPRTISSHELDRARRLGLHGSELSPWRVRQGGASEFNPAYVAAILRRFEALAPHEQTRASGANDIHPSASMPVSDDSSHQKVVRIAGRLKSTPRVGHPDSRGRPTAWAKLACYEEGLDGARMYSCVFYGETMNKALSLEADARLVVEGYIRPNDDPKWDTFSVFKIYV